MVHLEHSSPSRDLEMAEISLTAYDTSVSIQRRILEAPLVDLQSFLDSHERTLAELKGRLASSPLSIDPVPVDAQLHALRRFLDSHLKNIQALRDVSNNGRGSNDTGYVEDNAAVTNQLGGIVLAATFTAAVLVAFMSLLNDILSGMKVELFYKDGSYRYTPYSMGIVFGLLALGINLGVAMVAAINVALASYYSKELLKLKSRVLQCICGQFVAAVLSGVALILLIYSFDWITATATGIIYLGCMVLSMYFIQQPWEWKSDSPRALLTVASFVFSTATFAVSVSALNLDSWSIIPTFVITLLYHVLVLILKPPEPGWKTITPPIFLGVLWAACIAITLLNFPPSPIIIARCVCASIEVVIMAVVAFQAFRRSRKLPKRSNSDPQNH